MGREFWNAVEENPIIAAVKSMDDLEQCCKLEDIRVVFILFGDICSIGDIVKKIKAAGKIAMVHVDLIGGLSPREIAVEYLKNNTDADGIITTKPSLIKKAKELSLYTVLRYFLLDSMAYENILTQQHTVRPDFIEVLPGAMPKVIQKLCSEIKVPVIAGQSGQAGWRRFGGRRRGDRRHRRRHRRLLHQPQRMETVNIY